MVERSCIAQQIRRLLHDRDATPRGIGDRTWILSSQQGEVIRKIINVPDRQARPYFHIIYEFAPFENVVRRSFDPSWLVDRSPKEQTPIEKVRVH